MRRAASYRPSSSSRQSELTSEGRPTLHRRGRSLSDVYPATSISKYYDLNHQILAAFESLYGEKNYQVAYAVGMQFIETALLEIPKHGYYFTKRHEQERRQSSAEAQHVCQLLQQVVQEEKEKKRLADLEELARIQAVADYVPETTSTTSGGGWGDLSMFGQALETATCCFPKEPESLPVVNEEQYDLNFSVFEPRREEKQRRADLAADKPKLSPEEQQRDLDFSVFDKPKVAQEEKQRELDFSSMLEPRDEDMTSIQQATAVRDEAEQQMDMSHDYELERALFLSGLEVPLDNDSSAKSAAQRRPRKALGEIDIASLRAFYHEDFDILRTQGRVRLSTISTYQGRLMGSINGCTVIAPLLCIHHFSKYSDQVDDDDPGLLDADIVQVIDEETPALLPQVRDELGLTKDALIIPSDVHDILLNRQLLLQQQFVTVCGGNILNDAHMNELISAIVNVKDEFVGKKIAATVFFREHVVAILKLQRADGQVWFDLIDSLPAEYTLSRPGNDDDDDWESEYIPYAVRIRCLDEEALRATLRWYACSKFHDENCAYIDMYEWVDDEPDFDPRVFQAFVWAEA